MSAKGLGPRALLADLRLAAWHVLANVIAGSSLVPRDLRRLLYRALGIKAGTLANVYPHVTVKTSRLRLGAGVMVNQGCRFDNAAMVELGDGVAVGQEVLFCTTSHEVGPASRRAGANTVAPIIVGEGCWIGSRAVILPGVTIGAGCIVAAGAVVRSGCEPNGLYAGTPAERVKDLDPLDAAVTVR